MNDAKLIPNSQQTSIKLQEQAGIAEIASGEKLER